MISRMALVSRAASRLSLAETMATRNESRSSLLYLAERPNSAAFSRVRARLGALAKAALLLYGFWRYSRFFKHQAAHGALDA